MANGIDIIARGIGAKGLQEANRANTRLDALPKGLVYRGAVDYYSDLPSSPKVGDTYTVKYKGTSGTTPDGSEYAWGTYEGTKQWIPLGITTYGTVENVSAGEGLSITGDSTVNPTVEIAQGYKLPTDLEWEEKQEKLVNQSNIKSVNGETLLGSGDLLIKTYQPFPNSWPTTNTATTKSFCDAVNADANAVAGMVYLGEVRWSDLPGSMVNTEVTVEVFPGWGTSNKVLHLIITSGNTAPYRWEYTYWGNGSSVSGWIGFQPQLATQTAYTAQGDATRVPQITTNSLGQVTSITEVSISHPIPECPISTDGTFILQCVVANGVATYSWISVPGSLFIVQEAQA